MNRYVTRMYCGLITEKRDAASYLINLNVTDLKERVLWTRFVKQAPNKLDCVKHDWVFFNLLTYY